MNPEWAWNLKFNNSQVHNFITLREIAIKYNIKLFPMIPHERFQVPDSTVDLFVIFQTESNESSRVLDLIKQHKNRILVVGNVLRPDTPLSLSNENFCFAGDWMLSPVNRRPYVGFGHMHPYVKNENFTGYDFDCLLGRNIGYRQYIYDSLLEHGIIDRSLYSWQGKENISELDIETDSVISKNQRDSLTTVEKLVSVTGNQKIMTYFDDNISPFLKRFISRITPRHIYKNSLASIVRETLHEDYSPDTFITEKTAKPLWNKRVFFPLGNYRHCKNFESLGFKLLHDYDYYDSDSNFNRRVKKFAELLASIKRDDIMEMYENNQDKILHNYNLVSKNWIQESYDFVMNKVKNLSKIG